MKYHSTEFLVPGKRVDRDRICFQFKYESLAKLTLPFGCRLLVRLGRISMIV
jgi:hypothetical protein